MTIAMATKGVICPPAMVQLPQPSYSPILKFDVELVLSTPSGLLLETIGTLMTPAGFGVESIIEYVSSPMGLFIESDSIPGVPSSFTVVDTDYVRAPTGFEVEDV